MLQKEAISLIHGIIFFVNIGKQEAKLQEFVDAKYLSTTLLLLLLPLLNPSLSIVLFPFSPSSPNVKLLEVRMNTNKCCNAYFQCFYYIRHTGQYS